MSHFQYSDDFFTLRAGKSLLGQQSTVIGICGWRFGCILHFSDISTQWRAIHVSRRI